MALRLDCPGEGCDRFIIVDSKETAEIFADAAIKHISEEHGLDLSKEDLMEAAKEVEV